MTPKQEARLYNRAVKQRWNIPPEEMQKTVDRCCQLRDYAEKESVQTAAIQALISMTAQNQKDEHKAIDVRVITRNDQLPGIAAELGIDLCVIEAAAREADSSTGGTEAQSIAEAIVGEG